MKQRVNLDEKDIEDLEKIKREHNIFGNGHTNTISFLVRHYRQTENVEKIIQDGLVNIEKRMDSALRKVLKDFLINLLNPRE